jgi:hypothetical protein
LVRERRNIEEWNRTVAVLRKVPVTGQEKGKMNVGDPTAHEMVKPAPVFQCGLSLYMIGENDSQYQQDRVSTPSLPNPVALTIRHVSPPKSGSILLIL